MIDKMLVVKCNSNDECNSNNKYNDNGWYKCNDIVNDKYNDIVNGEMLNQTLITLWLLMV